MKEYFYIRFSKNLGLLEYSSIKSKLSLKELINYHNVYKNIPEPYNSVLTTDYAEIIKHKQKIQMWRTLL